MKNMNKVLAGLMAAGLLLTTGCVSTSTNSSSSTSDWYTGPGYDKLYEELGKADVDLSKADGKLKDILDKGQIVLATSPDYPPSEFVDDQGNVKGSDIMLAQYIANSLGVDLKVETMDFNAVLTAVDTGKVDIGISGFGYKADRAEQFELSHGYQSSSVAAHHTLLVPAEKADEYKKILNLSKNDRIRDTFYSEILTLISSYECGLASMIKEQSEQLGRKLNNWELSDLFDAFEMLPMWKPLIISARTKMASRDMALRDAFHYQLEEYIKPLDKLEYEKFLGEAGNELEHLMAENQEVLKRLKENSNE